MIRDVVTFDGEPPAENWANVKSFVRTSPVAAPVTTARESRVNLGTEATGEARNMPTAKPL